MSQEVTLEEWLAQAASELGCSVEGIDAAPLLDVARDVAHHQIRPGAPTTTFLVGYALGLWEQHLCDTDAPPTLELKRAQLVKLCERAQRLALGEASN